MWQWTRRAYERGRAMASVETVVPLGCVAMAVGLSLWLSHGAWGSRPPSGDDTMAHLSRARFAIHHLVPHGRVDGWDPTFILGYQEFLFIGPAFTWAVFALRVLTLGLLSTTGALKVATLGSLALLPVAVAFCARSAGLSRRSAGLAAILTLAVDSPFGGVGLQGPFNVGLLTHTFAAPLFFLALGGVLRVLVDPRLRWRVFASAALGGLLMAHGISVILLGAVLVILVPLATVKLRTREERRAEMTSAVQQAVRSELRQLGVLEAADDRPDPGHSVSHPEPGHPVRQFEALAVSERLVHTGFGAMGLAACTFLPFLAHRNLQGGYTGWATPPIGDRLADIWHGNILFPPGVAVLVVAGVAYGAYRVYEGRRFALALVVAPLAYLIVAHAAFKQWPNVITIQLPNRGLGYAGALAILPFAALIARLTRRLGVAGDVLAVAVAVAIVIVPLGTTRNVARQMAEPISQMRDAARALSRLVPDGARFATERYFPEEIGRTKVSNPDRWLAWASNRSTLNNFNVESSVSGAAAYEPEHIRDRPPAVVADSLSRLGVTHLVTLSDQADNTLRASPRFDLDWAEPPVSIFRVLPREGQPPPGALVTAPSSIAARLRHAAPEHVTIDIGSVVSSTTVDVAIAWSPKWHATVDGRRTRVFRATDGLMQIRLPAGARRLKLDFGLDRWDYLGLLVTMVTIAGGSGWLVRTAVRRNRLLRPATEGSPAS